MQPYQPIEDYGAIGNLHAVALVGRDGSIDWCSYPEIPDPSVFAAILDRQRGGRFRVQPRNMPPGEQAYVRDTNVLVTTFNGPDGRLEVTDFMPLRGPIDGTAAPEVPGEIHRHISCQSGRVTVHVEWTPRFDYARAAVDITAANGGFIATSGEDLFSLGGLDAGVVHDDGFGPSVRGTLVMQRGDRLVLVTRWDTDDVECSVRESMARLEETTRAWVAWAHKPQATGSRDWAGGYSDLVIRSELTLKLLTNARSGAFVAAPTTSLPEHVGGIRNWDYRYTWIRDAGMTAQALVALGHEDEARAYLHWVERVEERSEEKLEDRLQVVYGIHGETELEVSELDHLEGYRGSRPVRIGNEAVSQLQLDIFGETLDSTYELRRMEGELDEKFDGLLAHLADQAASAWRLEDYGLWEMQNGPRHFTYSKAMAWTALDRALLLVKDGGLEGDVDRWTAEREAIMNWVLARGYDPEISSFVLAEGSQDLDAANLKLALMEMLPIDDPRLADTIQRTMERLMPADGLVYRYRTDDGLPGEEGAFVLCSFWLVDALSILGRIDDAHRVFEGIAGRCNHLGLFSEEIDPTSGAFLGNFPQAFSHIGFINSTLYLAHAEGRPVPVEALIGTAEHRARVGRT